MRICAIDCGSNSFHLLIADISAHDQLKVIEDDKSLLYLGTEVASTGKISAPSILRAKRVIRHYKNLIERHDVEIVKCVATSAIRSATNGDDVIDALTRVLGHSVNVISGEEEAKLIFRAVSAVSTLPETRILACDMGGGSLELMAGQRNGLEGVLSVPLGASRLARQLKVSDPLTSQDINAIEELCKDYFKDFSKTYPSQLFSHIVASSGTLTSIITMARAKVDGFLPQPLLTTSASKKEIDNICTSLIELDPKEKKSLLGYESSRNEYLATAAVIAKTLSSLAANDASWIISPYALREGIVFTLADTHFESQNSSRSEIAQTSINSLVKKISLLSEDNNLINHANHANHVCRLSENLFTGTTSLHKLKKNDKLLLSYAALIHDLGETINHSKHDQHGAYILSNISLPGFTPQESTLLRGLIRWHRLKKPKKSDQLVGRLTEEEFIKAKWLSAILRIADGADSGKAQIVKKISVSIKPDVIFLRLHSHHNAELETYSARRKRGLLEEISGRDVIIEQALSKDSEDY